MEKAKKEDMACLKVLARLKKKVSTCFLFLHLKVDIDQSKSMVIGQCHPKR